MAVSYISGTAFTGQGNSGGVTGAGGVDTSGANFIVLGVSYFPGTSPTVSDSKGNTWTARPATTSAFGHHRLYYAYNATVGSGHTFDAAATSSFASLSGAAFSGVLATDPVDQENGATGFGTSLQTGSVTPTSGQNDELMVSTGELETDVTGLAIGSSFNLIASAAIIGGTSYGNALAYKIKTDGSAENPQWSWTNNQTALFGITTFKAAAGGGGAAFVPIIGRGPGMALAGPGGLAA